MKPSNSRGGGDEEPECVLQPAHGCQVHMAQDRPDLCVVANVLTRSMAKPRIGGEALVKKMCAGIYDGIQYVHYASLAGTGERGESLDKQQLGR